MIHIAICDDQATMRQDIAEQIMLLTQKKQIAVRLSMYAEAKHLLFDLPEDLDMLILDIEMPEINGLEAASQIRRQRPNLVIVFATSYVQYAIEGYRVGAFRYLLKPVNPAQMEMDLGDEIVRLEEQQKKKIQVKNNGTLVTLSIPEILFFEVQGHHLEIHCRDNVFPCNHTMAELEDKLKDCHFFRCHKSFLVNLAEVMELRKDTILLRHSEEIPVSKHRKKELKLAYTDYLGGLL